MSFILQLAGSFFTLLGLFVMVKIFVMPKKPPMDSSNRINHLSLVWQALNSPEEFVEGREWLTMDERDKHQAIKNRP